MLRKTNSIRKSSGSKNVQFLEDVIKSINKLNPEDMRDSMVTKGSNAKSKQNSNDTTPCPEPFKHPNVVPM